MLDLIGAARPSIADPFLPKKIEEGRIEDIRECIGCNICVAGDFTMSPSRCTQNPSMGEEWRRGWHPERIRAKQSAARVLVVGAGPAGLEAAMMLGRRGYDVALAEAGRELGGRVAASESFPGCRLGPGRATTASASSPRWRTSRSIAGAGSTPADMIGLGFDHIGVATGRLARDGVGGASSAAPRRPKAPRC